MITQQKKEEVEKFKKTVLFIDIENDDVILVSHGGTAAKITNKQFKEIGFTREEIISMTKHLSGSEIGTLIN